jgi:DNA (cytosine-5)-methyltransferase 1
MNELHLFAGAGGGILGGHLLGHTTVCAVEIEPYCRKVLLQRQRDGILPKFPIWDDVCTFDGKPWRGKVDVVCGGFPCQDISPARTNSHINGKQRGLQGSRSGLWSEMRRIINEVQPKVAFIENSPQLRTRGLSVVLRDIATMGYNAQWGVFGVRNFGADHIRERIFIYASNSNLPQCKRGELSFGTHQKYENFSRANWWQGESRLERVADGMANRVDRLKAIGNGQVPAVAATAFSLLSESLTK